MVVLGYVGYFILIRIGINNENVPLFCKLNVFYWVGLVIKAHFDKIRPILANSCILCILVFLYLILGFFWDNGGPSFRWWSNELLDYPYYYVTAFIGIFALFALCLKFIKQESSNIIVNHFIDVGKRTLGVYAIHLLVILPILNHIVKRFALNYYIFMFILIILTIEISVMVEMILNKGRLTSQILLGKTR